MHNVSALFATYANNSGGRSVEVQAIVNDTTTYTKSEIVDFTIEEATVPGEEFTLGTVIPSKLIIKIRTTDTIAQNAKIEPSVRLNGSSGWSVFEGLGEFYISTRSRASGIYTFECYDKLITTQQLYVSSLTYPTTMANVLAEMNTQLGFTLDSSVVINTAYEIPYKDEDISMNEMYSCIASANGGNFKLTRDGLLRLVTYEVVPSAPSPVGANEIFGNVKTYPTKSFTRIEVMYNTSGEFYEAGTGDTDHSLYITNKFATQAITDNLLTKLNGFTYKPYDLSWVSRPYLEAGDSVQITDRESNVYDSYIFTKSATYGGGILSTIKAPTVSEQESEFQYEGLITKLTKNSVQQNETYYGVTIGRNNGIYIARDDGISEVTFNSDKLEFVVNGLPKFYLDVPNEQLVYDGEFTARVINALSAIITPSLVSEKATISELTVDRLDTSDKVENFKNSVLDDVDYINIQNEVIEFITSSVNDLGVGSTQVKDRDDNYLYWTDATKVAPTTDVTEWPVEIYNYDDTVKMSIAFVLDEGNKAPKIQLGAGSGSGDNGKAFIYKGTDGLVVEYFSSVDGSARRMNLLDSGITFTPDIGGSGGGSSIYDMTELPIDFSPYEDGAIIAITS